MQISEDVIHHRDLYNSSRPAQSPSIIAKNELFSFVTRSISLLFLSTSRSKKEKDLFQILCRFALFFSFCSFNVRVVTSTDPGVGKSLVVQGLAEYVANLPNNLLIAERMREQNQEPRPLCVTIPLHDRFAGVADIVGFFLPHVIHSNVPLSRIFHLDSSCTVRVSKLRVED